MASATETIRVPAALAPKFRAIIAHLSEFRAEALGGGGDFDAGEQLLDELFAEAYRSSVGEMLASLDPQTDRIQVGDRTYRRMSLETGERYFTLRGPVYVRRALYREQGVRNGPTVCPVDLRAGMVEGRYTPMAANAAALLSQSLPSREAQLLCNATGILAHSRASQFRTGVDVGSRWESLRPDAALIDSVELPEDATTISAAVDRVSVPMAEARPPTAEDEANGVKRPITVQLRMAFVGVLTLHDKEGKPLTSIRYGHVPSGGAEAVRVEMKRDLDAIVGHKPALQVVALSDGAPEMQSIVDFVVSDHAVAKRITDFWHTTENLADAIRAHGAHVVEDQLADWKADLLERDDAIDAIERTLAGWASSYTEGDVPEGLHDGLTFIRNRRDRLRYATARAAGLPIGSGCVEATAKTVVSVRMKRAGCRWTEEGAQAILGLRALATSSESRWNAAMKLVLASYRMPVTLLPASA